jgi:hypothetical protein
MLLFPLRVDTSVVPYYDLHIKYILVEGDMSVVDQGRSPILFGALGFCFGFSFHLLPSL